MKCPFCGYTESKVIDTRPTDEGERIRRRRECLQCGKRFTSYEVVETTPVMVIKKDGSREAFSHDKLLRVARTIADLDGSEKIESYHLAEAIQYRNTDILRGEG